jgi:type I thyroxine 5'-deiodinase
LYESYQNRVAFYVVYIQEAHPTDLWQMPSNVADGVLFASPKTDDERSSTAQACVRKLGIRIPAVLDRIDNPTERAYTGWPDRLFLIDTNGRIRFKSMPGPYGFSTTNLEQSLREITGGSSSTQASGL